MSLSLASQRGRSFQRNAMCQRHFQHNPLVSRELYHKYPSLWKLYLYSFWRNFVKTFCRSFLDISLCKIPTLFRMSTSVLFWWWILQYLEVQWSLYNLCRMMYHWILKSHFIWSFVTRCPIYHFKWTSLLTVENRFINIFSHWYGICNHRIFPHILPKREGERREEGEGERGSPYQQWKHFEDGGGTAKISPNVAMIS